MDIGLISTFLEVVARGSFVAAAERLKVSQAAVSMRIQAMETELGSTLFQRGRGGAKLTPAGRQFQHHAVLLKRVWDQARLQIALPSGVTGLIRIGAHYSLWRHFLVRWFAWMRKNGSNIAVRTEAHESSTITQLLSDGMLDVGVVFEPEQRSGFSVERVFEEPLVLVSTTANSTAPLENGYVFVDWGPEFRKFHALKFAQLELPRMQTNLGAFAVEQILATGGSGFFPEPVVRPLLREGRLHRVKGAPRFGTPIYAVYQQGELSEPVRLALEGIRMISRQEASKRPN
jgi:LysR family transcriptional regulator, flagellar master operon regulator